MNINIIKKNDFGVDYVSRGGKYIPSFKKGIGKTPIIRQQNLIFGDNKACAFTPYVIDSDTMPVEDIFLRQICLESKTCPYDIYSFNGQFDRDNASIKLDLFSGKNSGNVCDSIALKPFSNDTIYIIEQSSSGSGGRQCFDNIKLKSYWYYNKGIEDRFRLDNFIQNHSINFLVPYTIHRNISLEDLMRGMNENQNGYEFIKRIAILNAENIVHRIGFEDILSLSDSFDGKFHAEFIDNQVIYGDEEFGLVPGNVYVFEVESRFYDYVSYFSWKDALPDDIVREITEENGLMNNRNQVENEPTNDGSINLDENS